MIRLTQISALALVAALEPAWAEVPAETVQSLSAPDRVETRIGTLEFKDGVPSAETAERIFDTLDFTRALDVYNNSFRGASAYALRKGFEEVAGPNGVVIFSELMDAARCSSPPTPTRSITSRRST